MPYPEVPATLGDHLRKRRHERGLLQKHAANHLGVNTFSPEPWDMGQGKGFAEGAITQPALRSVATH